MRRAVLILALAGVSCDDKGSEPTEPSAATPERASEPAPEREAKAPTAETGKTEPTPSGEDGSEVLPTEQDNQTPKVVIDPMPKSDSILFTIESSTPAASGGKLTQNVGVEAMPGRFVPTLAVECEVPCWQAAMVWPDDDATTVDIELFRGKGQQTASATNLGTFRVSEVPPAESGARSRVVLALGIDGGGLVAHARHRDSGKALPISRVR